MKKDHKISWTNETWNPVTGCDPVSPGCDNCYAKVFSKRLKAMGVEKYRNEFEVTLHPDVLDKPLRWKKPRMIFVNSMSDTFHHDVPDEFIDKIYNSIWVNCQHKYQILTKRPERSIKYYKSRVPLGFDHVWFGVTAENQRFMAKRHPLLMKIPAAIRFVSFEPLLSEIDIEWDAGKFDWAIIGCESGHKRRPCNLDWVYSIVDQCQNAQVSVFVKQLNIDGKVIKDINQFPADLQIQEMPG